MITSELITEEYPTFAAYVARTIALQAIGKTVRGYRKSDGSYCLYYRNYFAS